MSDSNNHLFKEQKVNNIYFHSFPPSLKDNKNIGENIKDAVFRLGK